MAERVHLIRIGYGYAITGSLPPAAIGDPYSRTLTAIGGVGIKRLEILSENVTDAIVFTDNGDNTATFAIADPQAAGTYSVTVRATDANRQRWTRTFTFQVVALPLAITGSLNNCTVGSVYSDTLTVSDGVDPYSLDSSVLPAGLSANLVGDTITVSGTPTGAGLGPGASFNFDASFTVTDDNGGSVTFEQTITITVTAVTAVFDPTPLLDATDGVAYTADTNASGGTGGYTYTKQAGPSWLSVNSSTGAITGTPSGAATGVTVTVRATDSEGNFDDVTDTINVVDFVAYPLDDYTTGLYGAWATRKLLSGYSGPCIELLDTGDSSATDIGFASGELDWSAIGALIGGGDVGRARTIYDQSGASNDLENSHDPTLGVPDVWRSGSALDGFDFINSNTRVVQTPANTAAAAVVVVCMNFVSRTSGPDSANVIFERSAPFNASGKNGAVIFSEVTSSNRPLFGISEGAANYVLSIYTGGSNFTSGVVTAIFDRNASGADKVKFRLNGTLQTRAGNYDAGTVGSGNHSSGERYYLGARGPIDTASLKAIFKTTALAIWELSTAPDETWLDGVEQSIGHTL